MIAYTHEGGYGNIDTSEVDDAIRNLPLSTPGRQLLLELAYDYECLRRVIEGGGFLFRHCDRSETRRIKLL